MRSLTKSGIRELTAKYRSILKKCAILNAMFLMLGVGSAMAKDMTWAELNSAINDAAPGATITIPNSVTRESSGDDIAISKELSIVGSKTDSYLSGVNNYKGLKINEGGILTIENITMQNFNNTNDGGAIYNAGTIESITGDFIGNTTGRGGGAIANAGTIKDITGNFKYNSAKNSSGAIYNDRAKEINFVTKEGDITFDGNYVTDKDKGKGGAIYNLGTVGLYADAGRSITFTGDATNIPDEDKDKATDVDGICNIGTLNINGYVPTGKITPVTYTGTVNLQNVAGNIDSYILGTTNIYGGTVNVKDTFIQKDLNLNADTLNLGKGGTVTNLNANGGALSMSIPYGTFDNYKNKISTLTVDKFTGTLNNFTVDFDPSLSGDSNDCMDKISVGAGSSGTINLTAVNVLGNSELPPPPVTATYLTGDGQDSITTTETGSIKTAIDGYTYTFTFDGAGKGNVLVTMNADEQMSLPEAIADATMTGYSAQLNPVIIYGDLGTLAGENRNFTIFGNGSTIDGNSHAGITVNNDQTFTLNDADMKNFTKTGANGGAIYNKGTASITGNFTSNSAGKNGGAIYNAGTINITGNFTSNKATGEAGGAIHNEKGKVYITDSNFSDNSVSRAGGAISTFNGSVDIVADNSKVIFQNNNTPVFGGAILAMQNNEESAQKNVINIIAENNDIIFSGNRAVIGGAIANIGTLNIKAKADHTVEFLTSNDTIANANMQLDNDQYQIHENIHSVLTINDAKDGYTGDVILQDVVSVDLSLVEEYSTSTPGDMVIGGGRVFANGNIEQSNITVQKAILALSEKTVTASKTTPLATSVFTLDNATLNLQNNSVGVLNIGKLSLTGNNNLMLDADLAGEKMDQLSITGNDGAGELNISDIRLLSATTQDKVSLSLFEEGTPSSVYDKVSGELTGLKYSPTYIYDAKYNTENGIVTFTRTEQANPYLYAPSTMAQTTASITGQIAGLAMDKLDVAVTDSEKGLAAGDLPKANNAWVKVMGFDDDVDFKHFNSVDSKAYTLAGGFNTDKVKFDNFDAAFGVYGGYIGGRQKYTGSKIEQDGGYIGLSSELTKGNAFLLSTINGGFINNESENMYGTDKFDTRWFGIGLKGGYNYALTDAWTLQPNIYAGYTLVNTEDYTSKSGVRINNDNLNFFEIDPGFRLSKQIDNGWLGYIQGKYAIVMDNGGETTVNEIVLPNISAKNYFEYGFGMNKSLTDAWSLNGEINRRDGGRSGWNGSVEFKYNF